MRSKVLYVSAAMLVVLAASCSLQHGGESAAHQAALRAAWHAYMVNGWTAPSADTDEGAYDATGLSAISALDSARSALTSRGEPSDRYLSSTLGGLVSTLKDRHETQVAMIRNERQNTAARARGDMATAKETFDTGMGFLTSLSAANRAAEDTILKLAAWERRYLHETYLADSYVGDILANVASQRAKGTPDSMLLQRPEVESRIALADSLMMAEIRQLR